MNGSPNVTTSNNVENGYDNPALLEDGVLEQFSTNGELKTSNYNLKNFKTLSNENSSESYVTKNDTVNTCNVTQTIKCNNEKVKNSLSSKKEEEMRINGINGVSKNILNSNKVSSLKDINNHKDYDPYQHICHKNPTTYWDTMFHLLKASLGTGILAMPNAFHNSGYLIGTIGTLIIGFLCTYNIHMLLSSEYELCRRRKVPSMSYPRTIECAFEDGPNKLRWMAPYGSFITNAFLFSYQMGTSAIYIVFISSNLKDVYDMYCGTGSDINVRLIMLYLLLPLVLICWIRNLKLLVPFSTIANVVTMLSFVMIFWYVFDDVPSIYDRRPIGPVHEMPLFFGTVLFAMEAIGVIMPLKNEMKKPEKFTSVFGVLNFSMLPITLLYTFIGFFGYLKYGEETKGSITLNLPSNEIFANLVRLLYSAAIYISYALSCYVAFDIVWNGGMKPLLLDSKFRVLWEYLVRTSIVLATFFMAVAIPDLELFISFIGAFCLSTMGVAFPAVIQLLVYWQSYTENSFSFILLVLKNSIVILIGILAFTIGVSTSIAKYFEKESLL